MCHAYHAMQSRGSGGRVQMVRVRCADLLIRAFSFKIIKPLSPVPQIAQYLLGFFVIGQQENKRDNLYI